jgi:response regulator RpfG family c-di-GMP phosphodiesterase
MTYTLTPLPPAAPNFRHIQRVADAPVLDCVLIMDDEESVRSSLGQLLSSRGLGCQGVSTGEEALELLHHSGFAVLLCDVQMPGTPVTDLVRGALEIDPDLAIVMLSGLNDAATAAEALSSGALDYLVKPIGPADLYRAVDRALRKRELLTLQRSAARLIREEVALHAAELEQERSTLRSMTVSVAETLINAMEAKDVYLRGHSQRVTELAVSIAAELRLDEDTIEAVRLAGRLHDVGMIGIRESVLHKPNSLDSAEFEHVKDHIRIGMEILAPLKHLGAALNYIRDHHERWDGSGYPRGLQTDAISIGGRILAAADAYDSLTSKRAYRESMEPIRTMEYLSDSAGVSLDPEIYHAMRTVILRRKSLVFIDDA